MKTYLKLAAVIGCLAASIPAFAHHSTQAEFDRTSTLTLVGKLTKVELVNPHSWLYIDAKDSEGKVVNWALELPGPAGLRRNGFDQDIFENLRASGEIVTVSAYAAKDGSKHALGTNLTRADGTTVIPLSRGGYGYGRGQGQYQ